MRVGHGRVVDPAERLRRHLQDGTGRGGCTVRWLAQFLGEQLDDPGRRRIASRLAEAGIDASPDINSVSADERVVLTLTQRPSRTLQPLDHDTDPPADTMGPTSTCAQPQPAEPPPSGAVGASGRTRPQRRRAKITTFGQPVSPARVFAGSLLPIIGVFWWLRWHHTFNAELAQIGKTERAPKLGRKAGRSTLALLSPLAGWVFLRVSRNVPDIPALHAVGRGVFALTAAAALICLYRTAARASRLERLVRERRPLLAPVSWLLLLICPPFGAARLQDSLNRVYTGEQRRRFSWRVALAVLPAWAVALVGAWAGVGERALHVLGTTGHRPGDTATLVEEHANPSLRGSSSRGDVSVAFNPSTGRLVIAVRDRSLQDELSGKRARAWCADRDGKQLALRRTRWTRKARLSVTLPRESAGAYVCGTSTGRTRIARQVREPREDVIAAPGSGRALDATETLNRALRRRERALSQSR